jgi:hypothetical protein
LLTNFPKKKLEQIDKIVEKTILPKKFVNQIKPISKFSLMNCTEMGEILTNFGRIWFNIFRSTQKKNEKIDLILSIFEIKKKLKELYISYEPSKDDSINFLNEELKKKLLAFFTKKGK